MPMDLAANLYVVAGDVLICGADPMPALDRETVSKLTAPSDGTQINTVDTAMMTTTGGICAVFSVLERKLQLFGGLRTVFNAGVHRQAV